MASLLAKKFILKKHNILFSILNHQENIYILGVNNIGPRCDKKTCIGYHVIQQIDS